VGAKLLGARVKRMEDPALLTGRGQFVDDLKLPGTLHAAFVRSPFAHARIRSLDAGRARAHPGVHAVIAAADLPAFCRISLTIKPSSDSDIKSEVWLPMTGWNGKFLQVGNGAWGGSIQYGALGDSLRRSYAAASTDTGHTGTDASFAMGHPEKLIDFGYRSVQTTCSDS